MNIPTSHASIAHRKQLPPQQTVGTIGTVWQESTPSKETTGPAHTNTQSTKNHQEGHPPPAQTTGPAQTRTQSEIGCALNFDWTDCNNQFLSSLAV